jgi:inhibitor of KinA
LPLGDSAITLVYGDAIDPKVLARILTSARALEADPPRAVSEIVPAYTTLSVWFNPLEREGADLAAELSERAEAETGRRAGERAEML